MATGIIIGSGAESVFQMPGWHGVSTAYGSAYLTQVTLSERKVILLRRHGPNLDIPPHLIDYRANIAALQQTGVDHIIATAAVGSTKLDLPPGGLAVVADFIDFTKRRASTMFDAPGSPIMHTDFSTPYCPAVSSALESAARELGIPLSRNVTYLCVEGPRYETPAEVRMFAQWGADVVGMTAVPEMVLAREAGICYGALAIITNYAAGVTSQPLSHEQVLEQMAELAGQIQRLLERAVALIPQDSACCK